MYTYANDLEKIHVQHLLWMHLHLQESLLIEVEDPILEVVHLC